VLLRWLLILSGLYLVLLGVLYFLQSRLIFIPYRELETDPGREGMAFEDVELVAADGVRLHAWWVPAAGKSRGALVFCHGNAGNISHRIDSIRIFRNLGLDTLIFDYRGYGKSGGEISEAGLYLDARAAWEHLVAVRKVPPERIVVFGRSLGGAVASRLAGDAAPHALILESTFTSVPDLAAAHYPWLPARAVCRYRLATVEHVAGVRCPLLVVHSPGDEAVPFAQGQRVYAAAPGPKTFLEIRGGHNDGFLLSGEDYVRGLAAFLDRELPEAAGSGADGGKENRR
jgi:hypothetical protein